MRRRGGGDRGDRWPVWYWGRRGSGRRAVRMRMYPPITPCKHYAWHNGVCSGCHRTLPELVVEALDAR